ncbi:MAG: hypothetical protein DME32_10835 [Verrucomicrobia bacterium]|nr:MAG: hypothetical protein DME32_10835 [Verrucomicrobiota bacterium]
MRFVFVMSRLSRLLLTRSVFGVSLLTTLGLYPLQETSGGTDWASTLTHDSRGNFPDPRTAHATYVYGWSGITAGTSEAYFHRGGQQTFVLEGKGRTVGLARILWKFDLSYRSVANAQTLRPLETHQIETARGKRIETNVKYSGAGVSSTRTEANRATPTVKDFALENLYDLHSVFLYLRSQPLRDRSVYRVAVYPANSAYVATVTVMGREHLRVRSGNYNAIKMDLKLQRVNKKNELEPHRKFKRANIWLSDDNDRVLLRIESQIFVGTVTAELQSIRFDND